MAWIEKRAHGVTRVVWLNDGKRHSITLGVDTDPDAVAYFIEQRRGRITPADVETQFVAGAAIAPSGGVTVQAWVKTHADSLTGIEERTRADYRRQADEHMASLTMAVDELGPTEVRAWVTSLTEKGLSPKTVSNLHGLLSGAMADAVDHDLRDANPCKRTRLPRRDRGAGDGDMTALTRAEWDKVRAGFDEARVSSRGNVLEPDALGSAYRDFFEVMVRTGLRWSEITALEPRHVDVETRTLRVEQAWKRQPDSSFILGAPKTPKSRRTIDLDAKSWDIVAARLTVKSPWLFPSPARPRARMSHTAAWMALSSASANAEIGKTPRIHDLRHTHASWLLAAGVDMYRVSRRLGHESIVTTTSTYGHLLPDTDATIVDALDRL